MTEIPFSARDTDAVHRLAGVLLQHGGGERERTLLGQVGGRADLLIALDRLARHPLSAPTPRWSEDARRAHEQGQGGMAAASLASLHRDGRVREAATWKLTDDVALPFLMLRTADHVPQIRDRARAMLVPALHPRAAGRLAGLALSLARRARADYAIAQVTTALQAAPADDLRSILGTLHEGPAHRFVFDLAIASGALDPSHLLGFALNAADWELRRKAADLLVQDAVRTRRPRVLHDLADAAVPDVRVTALIGLDRLGLLGSAEDHLVDPSLTVRAFARDAYRRAGHDPAVRYRELVVTGTPPAPGALAGLGECGTPGDAAPLARWLDHPSSEGRRQALRALDRLDASRLADHALTLLTDSSAEVIREAARALRPLAGRLPTEDVLRLLTHDRHEVRRAAYSILRERPGWTRLRAALTAAVDDEPKVALRARTDAVWWVRRDEPAHVPPREWHRITRERLPVLAPDEHLTLSRLTEAAAPFLSSYAVAKLHRHLDSHRATPDP